MRRRDRPGGRRLAGLTLGPLALALLLVVAAIGLYGPLSATSALQRLEAQALDLRFRLRAPGTPPESVVMVVIDDRSLEALGRWPWSRGLLADLLDRLEEAGARVVAIDLLLGDPESGGATEVAVQELFAAVDELARASGQAELRRLSDTLAWIALRGDVDGRLARTIARMGNVVLAYAFDLEEGTGQPDRTIPPAFLHSAHGAPPGSPAPALSARAVQPPLPVLAAAAAALGHVNVALDPGGAARFEYPLIGFEGGLYPSFAIETARLALGLPRAALTALPGEGIRLGRLLVATDESYRLLVGYRRDASPQRFSFVDVLAGRVDRRLLRDKVVIVGAQATGLRDTFVTPYSAVLPGAERHATVIANILEGDSLIRRDAGMLIDLGIILLGGTALGLAALKGGLLTLTLTFLLVALAHLAANLAVFLWQGLWFSLVLPLLALALIFAVLAARRHQIDRREQHRIRTAFGHYLDPVLVEALAADPGRLELGGEERVLTVLFADLRGFTGQAERLAPQELLAFLNRHLEAMARVVIRHGGMVDKFTGDGLLAVFGAPLPQPDHALRACRTALVMVEELATLDGATPLALGIGVNTGRW